RHDLDRLVGVRQLQPGEAELVVVRRPVAGPTAQAPDRFRPPDPLPTGSPQGPAPPQPPRHVPGQTPPPAPLAPLPGPVAPRAERQPVFVELGRDRRARRGRLPGQRSQGFAGLTASRSTSSVPIGFPTWV